MSLYLRRIAVDGFRKFREPMAIEGLTDGLNIVIEPNETGKSTVLEALRAAFFVRHGTKNQLAQSFAPYGEAVGPEIRVSFDADGAPWTVTKRFLRGASIEVTGHRQGSGRRGRSSPPRTSRVGSRHQPEGRCRDIRCSGAPLGGTGRRARRHRARTNRPRHGPIDA